MKKLYLSMLMAVGLLISGNVGAQNVCKIGDTEYESLQAAFDAVPTDGTETTIEMIADITNEIASGNAYAIAEGKNVVFDLKGHSIKVTSTENKNTSVIANAGTLEIKDSQTGGLIWLESHVKGNNGSATILNIHDLTITSGTIQNATVESQDAPYYIAYAIDNAVNWPAGTGYHTQWHDITCTINGGHIISHGADGYIVPAIRLYDQCNENNITLTMNAGVVEGQRGIYIQKAGRDASKDQIKVYINDGTIIGHGNTSNGDRPWAIDVEADANSPKTAFDAVEIKIEDGTIDGKISLGRNNGGTELGCEKLDIKGGNFTYHNVILNGHANTDFYEGCPNTLVGCVSGGKFFFDPNAGKPIRTAYVTEIQFASDWGGEYAKGYDEFNKYYGDLANRAGWEALGYTVEKIQTPEGKEGDWYAIVKYTASTEDYKNFLKYIKEGYMAVDITGTAEGRTEGVWPNKTITIGEITPKEMSGTGTWDPEDSGETTAVTIADGANITIPANTTVEAYSVNVTNGTLNIGEGATLIVGAGGVVEGETININIGNENGSGAIKISPDATTNNRPRVRVNLTTIAHTDTYGAQHWQFFARPTGMKPESFKVLTAAGATNHYISGYNGTTNSYTPITNPKDLGDYEGYAITNNSTNGGVVYQFEGELNPNQNAPITFKNNGFSLMGNSYLAPISIKALFNGIIEEVEPEFEANNSNPTTAPILKAPMGDGENTVEFTVWIYNCKNQRFEQINALKAKSSQLQPMQGFFMKLREGTSRTAAIDYINAVWNNDAQAGPILAPVYNNNGMGSAAIVVSANGCADQIDLFEDAEFDNSFNNGADASKLMNLQGMFNLYAQTEAGTLSCVASDNIEGTILTFQANNASEYELSFSDVENMNYSLIDLTTGNLVEMNEGNVYHFNAIPNSTEARFQIVTAAKAPTAMDKVVNTKVVKGIYSMTGAYLGEAKDFNALPQGVYVVNGEKIVK